MNYLLNTLKLSIYGLLWGFPVPIILALLMNRIQKQGSRKSTASDLYAEFYICNSTLWYGSYAVITGRTFEQAAWD